MKFLTPLTLVVALVGVTLAYPNGAPVASRSAVCQTMFPSGHGASATASTEPLPFEFQLGATCYKANMEIPVMVTLKEGIENYFQGLFVQARKDDNTMASFGMFDASADDDLKAVDCFDQAGSKNALTQASSGHYRSKSFMWTAPATGKEDIKFQMTIVHETRKFWVDVFSDVLEYEETCMMTDTISTTENTISTTENTMSTTENTMSTTENTIPTTTNTSTSTMISNTQEANAAATFGVTSLALLLSALQLVACSYVTQ